MVAQTDLPQVQLGPVDLVGALAVVLGAYLFVRFASFAVTKVSERTVEYRIAVKMALPVLKAAVYGAVAYYILGPFLQLTPSQLLAISGLIGAAIGFGVKDLFSSLVGGLIVILEQPYKIGDKVTFGDTGTFGPQYGEVVDIGIRSTTLLTPGDTEVIVPNDAVFKTAVANANGGLPEMLVSLEFAVAVDTDVEAAVRIVEEALSTSRYVFVSEERPVVVLEEDRPYYRVVRGKAYVNDVRNEFPFRSDVTRRVRRAFEREGVAKPKPALCSLHDRDGRATQSDEDEQSFRES